MSTISFDSQLGRLQRFAPYVSSLYAIYIPIPCSLCFSLLGGVGGGGGDVTNSAAMMMMGMVLMVITDLLFGFAQRSPARSLREGQCCGFQRRVSVCCVV